MNNTPERIILDIEPYGRLFWQNHILSLIPYISDSNKEPTLRHIYNESFRQLFDIMTPDTVMFVQDLHYLPDFTRFSLEPYFTADMNFQYHFKKAVFELGLGIYFKLHDAGVFHFDEFYMLDHVTLDCLLLFKTS